MRTRRPRPLPGTVDTTPARRPIPRRRATVVMAAVAGLLVGAAGTSWAAHDFPDVPTDHPFHSQIAWMDNTGITGGFPDGTYRPGAAVTRGSMAAFMRRLFDLRDTVKVVSGNFAPIDTPEGTWVNVPSMTTTVNVPPGTTATILVRYGAETLCADTDGSGYCAVRLLRNNVDMSQPTLHNTALIIDSVTSTAADDGSEAHMIERWATNALPGNHTIRVQATEGSGGVSSFTLDNQTLVVEVILNPS